MKYEWRKSEKELYLPKNKPTQITIPSFNYFMIEGEGNPNNENFGEYIGVLYALSYAIRMSHKGGTPPKDFYEYTVYPLEGVWDITDEAKKYYNDTGIINKDTLVYNLMIRQPDFVTAEYAAEVIERTKKKKPHVLLDKVEFGEITEGKCVQMLHLGPYDNEAVSFKKMEEYCSENKITRLSKKHREIYLSDVRKVSPEKLKTILRFKVK